MKPRSRRLVFLIALSILASLSLSVSANNHPCEFPAIFNFGDSNSDTGGRSAAFGFLGPPYGETYFDGPSPGGRHTDGRLIVDYIEFGIPHLSAFLDALGTNFTHGANFASAGSTIRPLNLSQTGFNSMSLDVQLTEFTDFHRRSQIIREKGGIFGGLMPKAEDFSRALYTFDIGQNDLSSASNNNKTIDEIKAFIPDLISQLKATIKSIHDQGGRSFWIHNTGPFGCTPAALSGFLITAAQIDDVGCAAPFNDVDQYFNSKLKEAVYELRDEFPTAALTYVDVYSIKYDLISHAQKYGFEQPLTSCCGYGGKFKFNLQILCASQITVDGEETIVGACNNPSARISWDGIHYTQAANKWISRRIIDGWYSDPPIPLRMACRRESEIGFLRSAQ